MYKEAPDKRKPIGVLMIEHRLIERALKALETRVQPTAAPDAIAFAELIDFFGNYADATHHGKEDDILFAEADRLDLSGELKQTLAELREDHARFRGYRRAMAEANRQIAAGNKAALTELSSIANDFIPRLRQHIRKEDKVFFPGFDQKQSPNDRESMTKRFIDFDLERIHQTYRDLVERNE